MPRTLLALMIVTVACGASGPAVADDVPADLAEVVAATLDLAADRMPAHQACMDGLTIGHAWELEDRAEYRPGTSTIVLRVPATAPHLEFSLIHEIAHHLEFSCPAQVELRPAFLAAQGLGADADWFTGDTWETTPSEQFATAVARVVTRRLEPLRPVALGDETLALVEAWARDGVTHAPSAP